MKKLLVFLIFVLLLNLFYFPKAQSKKIYITKRINPHPPMIDSHLEDPAWKSVAWAENFIQRKPYEGKKPTKRTAFKILYDNHNLYIAIRAFDNDPSKIVRRIARRDNIDGDWVSINIDSYHDHRTAFSFSINAAGVKLDEMITNDGDNWDANWNPIWYGKARIDDQGWIAELRIPLNQLRFSDKENQVWGLQVIRYLFRKEEQSTWQFVSKNTSGWVRAFGELHGLKNIKSKRLIELIPYSVGKTEHFSAEDDNPFNKGSINGLAIGLDGKIGLTNNLTLDFTINPDFGQVEADPSEINLTAYETFFEEKRPFFIEGKNIFNFRVMTGDGTFSSDNLFYSRRLGSSPHHWPDTEDDEYLNMPENTSIIAALKVSGKTRHGLSIGLLDSITSREYSEIDFLGQRRHEIVEPFTNYLVLRLQQDYNKGSTTIGGMFTTTNRHINDPELNFLHNSAYTGGLDFFHSWKNKTYSLSVKTVFSHVRGSQQAIQETQESAVHYFQRPDASHLEVDPERTSLTGHGGTIYFLKAGDSSLRLSAGVTWRSPGLELNDVGYLRSSDVIMGWVWANYRILKPTLIFRDISFNFNQWRGWNFGKENIFDGGNIGMWGQFKNYWSFSMGLGLNGESLSSSALRGGPSLRSPGGLGNWISFNTDSRKKIKFNAGRYLFTGRDNYSNTKNYWFGCSFQPSNALTISIYPSLNNHSNLLQYVDTQEFADTQRYIFATLNQKTVAVTIRFNFSISPDLSIQFYGMPFISAGNYSQFKHITDSRAARFEDRFRSFSDNQLSLHSDEESYLIDEDMDGFEDYSFEKPDFNFLEFRSNLVIRWEYKPGSTLYLVWSQGRTDYTEDTRFNFGGNLNDLFNIPPHNVFLIKFTHCFNL